MIATLKGKVSEKIDGLVIVETGGVGYGLITTTDDNSRLLTGAEAKFYIYEHIRESSYDLYGFTELDTKKLFEQLLDVSGVGPKMAVNIMGLGPSAKIKTAIASGDIKFIQSANGVGKRVAERLVVELKDKVGLVSSADDQLLFASSEEAEKDEAVQALINLGYSLIDAQKALKQIDTTLSTEERIKQALKGAV